MTRPVFTPYSFNPYGGYNNYPYMQNPMQPQMPMQAQMPMQPQEQAQSQSQSQSQSQEQSSNMGSPIQTIQNTQFINPQAICYFVYSKDEMQGLKVEPNTFYIGINKQTKEIYVRSWNNDGNIEFNTYTLADNKQEVSELKTIMTKLNLIEEKINERYDSNAYTTNNDRTNANAKQSGDGFVQPNDARKNPRTTVSNTSKLSEI